MYEMYEMSQDEFNYWCRIVYYQEQGYSMEEARKLAYKDLIEEFENVNEIIESK